MHAAELVEVGALAADAGHVRGRAVAPDRVGALSAAAGLLAHTGVDRLEVVDVAVGLVEVAVAVVVVPVPLVELGEVRVDLVVGLACSLLLGVPAVQPVLEQPLDVARADDVAAVVRAVRRLVVRQLHPILDRAVDGVLIRRVLEVEVAHRADARLLREEQVLVVALVEVRRPDGRVVDRAVRLRDRVVQRARRATVVDGAQRPVGVGRLRVSELHQHGPDRVFALALELDELDAVLALLALLVALRLLVAAELRDLGVLGELALQLELDRFLDQLALLEPLRARKVGLACAEAVLRASTVHACTAPRSDCSGRGQDQCQRGEHADSGKSPHRISPLIGDPLTARNPFVRADIGS